MIVVALRLGVETNFVRIAARRFRQRIHRISTGIRIGRWPTAILGMEKIIRTKIGRWPTVGIGIHTRIRPIPMEGNRDMREEETPTEEATVNREILQADSLPERTISRGCMQF